MPVDCPNAYAVTGQKMRCHALDGSDVEWIAGPDNPNHVCNTCKSQWVSGPPTADSRTPVLLDIISPPASHSRGLGDTIAKFTHATGLDKVAALYSKVTGKDCGCKGRQDALNKLVPYNPPTTAEDSQNQP